MAQVLDRKAQIKTVAQNLFRTKGYSATSMRDLAKEVGLEPASLYSHISSKEDILSEICFRLANQFLDANKEIPGLELSAIDKLKLAIENHILIITANLDASGVFLHDWKFLETSNLNKFKEMRDQYENIFLEILKQGKDECSVQVDDIKLTLVYLLSSLNWIYDWYKEDGKYNPKQLAQKMINTIFEGIKS